MLSDWKQSTFCSVNFQLQSQNCGKERVLRWCPLISCRQSHPAATTAGMLYLYAFPVSIGSGRKVICLAFTLFYIFPSVFWASTQPLVLPTPIRLPFTPGLSRTARWSHNLLSSSSGSPSLLSILAFLSKNSFSFSTCLLWKAVQDQNNGLTCEGFGKCEGVEDVVC